jgi:hypothetical protein
VNGSFCGEEMLALRKTQAVAPPLIGHTRVLVNNIPILALYATNIARVLIFATNC